MFRAVWLLHNLTLDGKWCLRVKSAAFVHHLLLWQVSDWLNPLSLGTMSASAYIGAVQVVRNADGGGGCLIFWGKALRRCNVQCY